MGFYKDNWESNFMKDSFRSGQRESLDWMAERLDEGLPFIVAELPTGMGKSCMAMTLAKTASKAYIATSQNILIEQYEKEFSSDSSFATIKGKGNYVCRDWGTCQDGARKCSCYKRKDGCAYQTAKQIAQNAGVCFTNTKYFALACNRWQKRDLTIIDEAHNLPADIMSMTSISLSNYEIERLYLGTAIPDFKIDNHEPNKSSYPISLDEFYKFAETLYDEMSQLKGWIENGQSYQSIDMEVFDATFGKLEMFLSTSKSGVEWIADWYPSTGKGKRQGEKVVARPVDTACFAKDFFYNQSKQIIMQSATIVDFKRFAEECGMSGGRALRKPSPFDLNNRPIYVDPIGGISNKTIDQLLPIMAEKIEDIMEKYPNDKGMIHTNSYKIQSFLENHFSELDRCLFPKSNNRREMLEEHFNSSKPTVIFSPSMTEGVDGYGDRLRFQVICKVPYPDLGDRRVAIKMKRDGGWYQYQTAKTIVQAIGRGMRHENDWCHNYVLDDNFKRLINMYKDIPSDITNTVKFL